MADYLRQMPHQGSADLARRPSAASRFHIDIPLLLLLLVLTVYGLFVLYSGSGKDMGAVVRQGRSFCWLSSCWCWRLPISCCAAWISLLYAPRSSPR